MTSGPLAALLAVLVLVLTGCSKSAEPTPEPSRTPSTPAPSSPSVPAETTPSAGPAAYCAPLREAVRLGQQAAPGGVPGTSPEALEAARGAVQRTEEAAALAPPEVAGALREAAKIGVEGLQNPEAKRRGVELLQGIQAQVVADCSPR